MAQFGFRGIQRLVSDEHCYKIVRGLRWSDGTVCPHCHSRHIIKRGHDDTQLARQKYECKDCGKRFDDLSGVIGLFNPGHNEIAWPRSDMESMVSALSHRGPDTSDFFVEPGIFLGHTRLAVLDLSSAGRQPMLSSDCRWVISYNGEIYNFRNFHTQLQQKWYLFKTETDTEVILAAWMEWGKACLNMLDGIFAFALYNPKQRRLFLVCDHLGIGASFSIHSSNDCTNQNFWHRYTMPDLWMPVSGKFGLGIK
ncbi:MAG: transposase [Magnetococcus sp. THC-1_WYH]